MNYWPTDTEDYYLPATQQLSRINYTSQLHVTMDTETVKWLHGKEMFILSTAFLQKLIGDNTTLRPFLLLGIVAVFLSSLLIFLIVWNFCGDYIRLVCYVM